MGRKASVVLADVERVMLEMVGEGVVTPGPAAVRQRLSKGSLSTVAPLVHQVLERWAKNKAAPEAPGELEPPADVLEAFMTAAKAMYRAAATELAKRRAEMLAEVDAERAAFRGELKQVAADSQEAHERADGLAEELSLAREQLVAANSTSDGLREDVSRLQRDMDDERARLGADIVELRQRLADSEAEKLASRDRMEAAIVEAATLRGRLEAIESERAAAGQQLQPPSTN